jgi:predicted site-specific integrase-resolvase
MSNIDPLDELEQQVKQLESTPITEENQEQVLESVNSLLSSVEEKLETILKTLTEE